MAYTRWPIWGAIEAQTDDHGARGPAGVKVNAVRIDRNEIVASGTTDASGYLTVTPLPANGKLTYKLAQSTT